MCLKQNVSDVRLVKQRKSEIQSPKPNWGSGKDWERWTFVTPKKRPDLKSHFTNLMSLFFVKNKSPKSSLWVFLRPSVKKEANNLRRHSLKKFTGHYRSREKDKTKWKSYKMQAISGENCSPQRTRKLTGETKKSQETLTHICEILNTLRKSKKVSGEINSALS